VTTAPVFLARALPWLARVTPIVRRRRMTPNKRILILGRESARLFALSGYLTQRGFQVDRTHVVDEAHAMLRGLRYRAVVACINADGTAEPVGSLLRDLKVDPSVHTVALLESPTALSPSELPNVDDVFGAGYSIGQFARSLCTTLGN
jgi:hypothetical protein